MAYNVKPCVTSLGNTGLSRCKDKLGYDAMLVYSAMSFEFASESAAETEATWLGYVNSKDLYPFPVFIAVEPAIEDDVKQDLPTGISLHVRDGKYGGKGMFEASVCDLIRLRTFNEVAGRAFIVTSDGQIFGTSPDGVKFRGFELSSFHVSLLKGTDGSTNRLVELDYQFKNPSEMGDYGALPQLDWDPLTSLVGIINVDVEVSSSAAATVVVTIKGSCDESGIEGLVAADFTVVDSNGDSVADDFAETGDGVYTFTFDPALSADTYTVDLADPADQTTGGYESTAEDTWTIAP